MDLSLLRHLSDAALRDKARERGLAVEGLERAALIVALQDELAREPDAPPARAVPIDEPEDDEPIRTRTMAELLSSQGHVERAARILRELCEGSADASLHALLAKAEDAAAARSLAREAKTILRSRSGQLLELIGARPRCAVVFRAGERGLDGARALVGDGQATLRIVTVRAQPDRSLETRTVDVEIAHEGFERLELAPAARVIVSLGLQGDRGFASITHLAL